MSDSSDHKKNTDLDETARVKTYVVKSEFLLDTASLHELAELIMEEKEQEAPTREKMPPGESASRGTRGGSS